MEISPFGVESAINNLQWRMECIINNPGWRSSILPRSLVRRPATLSLINRCAVFGQPPAHRSSFAPCGWHSDQGDRFITKRRVQKLESMRYQPTNPGSFPSSRFWPRIIADSSMSQAIQRRPRLARRGQRRPSRRRRVSSSSRRSGMTTARWVRLYQTTSPGDLPGTLSRDTMNRL